MEFARLPTNVRPIHYDVSYDVLDLERYRFEGRQEILLTVKEDNTSSITCHAVDLSLTNVTLESSSSSESYKCISTTYIPADQTVTFNFDKKLVSGTEVTLRFSFLGILNNELRGLYRSTYKDLLTGKDKTMAVTQFEACDARRALACWDEPAIKSTFTVSVVTSADLTAISNMHVVRTNVDRNSGNKTWSFAKSPIMSTYLLALVVGEFDVLSTYSSNGVLVSVYTPLGKSAEGKFALDVAASALSLYEARYRIDYPLRKLDMLAIPDFAAGAMENWGCITYRETRLLIDDSKSSVSQKTAVARTVCHELVHQWFGNLVTMEWWTSLWLNEGFARYMEFDAVNTLFPEWKVWDRFVQEITMTSAMGKDAMATSHPIEVKVNHPDEVDQIFDVISYAKGASVIRMISSYLTRKVFDDGIHLYLTKFAYGNAKTTDLWDALQEAAPAGQDITTMMNSWTMQMGFPVLTVDCEGVCRQTQFTASGEPLVAGSCGKWDIPMSVMTAAGNDNSTVTTDIGIWKSTDAEMKIPSSVEKSKWFKLNPDQSGFYIVNYSSEQWNALSAPVSNLTLNAVDRVSLLSSAFKLARSGMMNIEDTLDFCKSYQNDPEYLVWRELSSNLRFYLHLMNNKTNEFYVKFKEYVATIFAQPFANLGWEALKDEAETTGLFRVIVLSMLGATNPSAVRDTAKEKYDKFIDAGSEDGSGGMSADIRGIVLSLVAKEFGNEKIYDDLTRIYLSSGLNEEKLDCLSALGRIACAKTRRQYLSWALNNVRSQDIQYAFGSVATDQEGADLAWAFLQENWDLMAKKFVPFIHGRIVLSVIQYFRTETEADGVKSYLEPRKHDSYVKLLEGVLEKIQTRHKCRLRDVSRIEAWLAKK